jgi:hypothetical protein
VFQQILQFRLNPEMEGFLVPEMEALLKPDVIASPDTVANEGKSKAYIGRKESTVNVLRSPTSPRMPVKSAPAAVLILLFCSLVITALVNWIPRERALLFGEGQRLLVDSPDSPAVSLAHRLTIKELIPTDSMNFLRLPWNEIYGHEMLIFSMAPVKGPVGEGNWILRFQIFLEFYEKPERCCPQHAHMSNKTWEMDMRLSLEVREAFS